MVARRWVNVMVVVVVCGCVLGLWLCQTRDFNDISCLFEQDPHDKPFAPRPGPAIFFVESSCNLNRPALNARQACAVESAARAHPSHTAHVLFASPRSAARAEILAANPALGTPEEAALAALLTYHNVMTGRVRFPQYAATSPLEEWVQTSALNKSHFCVSHASDVLRYLTLWKFPGIYLDLDVVVARPLDSLGANWVGRESPSAVAAGAISFSGDAEGRRIAAATIRELRASFDGSDWGQNGPGVIKRVLQRHCHTTNPILMSPERCSGFAVYPANFLYPVSWQDWDQYTQPRETERLLNASAYVYHMWNKFSSKTPLDKDSGAPYTELARVHCPTVFAATTPVF